MVKVQFSVDDLRTPESLERVLRQFQEEFIAASEPPLDLNKLIPAIRDQLQAPGRFPINTTVLLGAPSSVVTSFSDDFNRADTAVGLGTNWFSNHCRPNTAGVYQQVKILSNQAVFQRSGGGGNNNPGCFWLPRTTMSGLWGLSQFAQATFIAQVGVSTQQGPAVMCTPDWQGPDANGYMAYVLIVAGVIGVSIRRANTANTLLSSVYTIVANDVILISVIATAASNTITLSVNGVAKETVVDTNAARPVATGCPGFCGIFVDSGESMTFDNFSCGAL